MKNRVDFNEGERKREEDMYCVNPGFRTERLKTSLNQSLKNYTNQAIPTYSLPDYAYVLQILFGDGINRSTNFGVIEKIS